MSCRYALSALLGLTLLASGCAGGFSRHYQAADDHVRPVDTLESCTAPRVEKIPASVMEERLAAALADGYVRLAGPHGKVPSPLPPTMPPPRRAVWAPASCSRA